MYGGAKLHSMSLVLCPAYANNVFLFTVVSPVIRMNPWKQNTPPPPTIPGGHLGIASLILKEHLELKEPIGEGEFGSVLRGERAKSEMQS